MTARCVATFILLAALNANCGDAALAPAMNQESASGITHSFLVCGNETYIVKDEKIAWTYPGASRDGWVSPDGILLAVSKCKEYPGGAVIFVQTIDKKNETKVVYNGTQAEVHSLQPIEDGKVVLTEGGPKPRLLEVNRDGKISVEFSLQCQIPNVHMQTRMARKLPNGNYLVPHLLDFAVKEYKPDGTVVNVIKTPDDPKESWPFTAIR